MHLVITPSGVTHCIYSEAIDLQELGIPTIQRASHVEPNATRKWIADMSPVDGPKLGPFRNRSDALEAEVVWIEKYWLNSQ